MTDKKALIELVKSVLIVLLFMSAGLLLYLTGYYSGAFTNLDSSVRERVEGEDSAQINTNEIDKYAIAQAKEVSVSSGMGGRYSVAFDNEGVDEIYGRFSAFIAEALGSAGSPQKVSAERWLEALEGESVYVRYFSPQALASLSSLLGTRLSPNAQNISSDEFCLYRNENKVSLFYKSGNACYSCSTAVSGSALGERISEYSFDNSFFSHEDKLLDSLDKSLLILRNFSSVPTIESAVPDSSAMLAGLMKAFDINEYTTSHYREAGGRSVYVDGNCILRVAASGNASYEFTGESAILADSPEIDSVLELAWLISMNTVGSSCGDAKIYLSGTEAGENGKLSICFDYLVNGIPVYLGDRHAAEYVFSNEILVSSELVFRSYEISGESISILPMYQAAAIASSEGKARISLSYVEAQDKTECVWVNE